MSNTSYVELPAGCVALCGDERLLGFPGDLETFDCNTTVSVTNCSSVCLTLAEEVGMAHQTWLGMFVMCVLAFWPMYSMGKHTGWDIKQVSVAVTVAAGWLNAVVLGWRLFGRAVAAMSADTICLWPHPYEQGGTSPLLRVAASSCGSPPPSRPRWP